MNIEYIRKMIQFRDIAPNESLKTKLNSIHIDYVYLEEYFFQIIKFSEENKAQLAKHFWDDKIKYIKKEYLKIEFDEQKTLLTKKISEYKREDSNYYYRFKRTANEVLPKNKIELYRKTAKLFREHVKSCPSHIHSLEIIARFEETVKSEIIWITLFTNLNNDYLNDNKSLNYVVAHYALKFYYLHTAKELPFFEHLLDYP